MGGNAPPAQLVCTVDAFPSAKITWSRGLTAIESGSNGFTISQSGSTSTLTVTMSSDARRGSYMCRAVNRLGETSQEYVIRKKGTSTFCFIYAWPRVACFFKSTLLSCRVLLQWNYLLLDTHCSLRGMDTGNM